MLVFRFILALLAALALASPSRAADPAQGPSAAPTVAPTPGGVAGPARPGDAPAAANAARQRAIRLSPDDASLEWGPCPPLFAPGCQIAVLQGDPAKPQADIFFRVPGGSLIPPHWHSSAEHMILVSGELEVHYKGQEAVTLKAGDYAYGPPKLPHLGRCRSQQACQLFISFDEPVDAEPFEGPIP